MHVHTHECRCLQTPEISDHLKLELQVIFSCLMAVLRIKLDRSSKRTVYILNHGAISQAPYIRDLVGARDVETKRKWEMTADTALPLW